ncbi:redoxin domain-containing protein [Rubrivirga sp. S365]|uniref:Redoxin domain-containing protein n=1 Tax=Rubrivirga litoralis TaxID=3075598 RepID=A0ABU3BTB8_9BACT|nr:MULTISPECIES: redoxin domain-containing protein [unclassified Rubrivirga]MDT0632527.1 redoxin domain-containing protein [Rubrivirga sp. F394]MDT7856992.1 redoxin domain-containing protein [Rubrivirga sp. S365]
MTRFSAVLAALVGLSLAAGAASAQTADPTPLPLTDRTLRAADGSSLSFGSAAGPEGLVVVFWSTACPWDDRYAPRLSDLVASYGPAGVGFVLVTSEGPAAVPTAAPAPRRRPASAGLAAPYVDDVDGSLAAAFGARSTPHVFFYGPDRTLVYEGAIDDSPVDADRVRTPYLRQALDQSIAGLPVEVMRTQAFGCTIKGRS